MARIVRFHQTGGPEVLKIEQVDVPPPRRVDRAAGGASAPP
jgi:hypothetical protein